MELYSRHPRINYWFWTDDTLKDKGYLKTLERIAAHSLFDTLTLTDRGCDFWDPIHKETFRELVQRAHELGLNIVLQFWPKGFEHSSVAVSQEDAAAMAVDTEAVVTNGKAVLRSADKWVRGKLAAPAVGCEYLYAAAFKKTAEGYYEEDTLVEVTNRLQVIYNSPERITAVLDAPELEDRTVFAVAAHYHRTPDVFSHRAVEEYKTIMDLYADIPLDGVALDEFKGLVTDAPWTLKEPFRGRLYGKAFAKAFRARTGKSLCRTLFDMRYCPVGKDEVRIAAINDYFDTMRRGTMTVENFVYDYSKQRFGEKAFTGFHNTYHNALTNDEIWNTGCSWWEVKRDYAQTDENIIFPVRLGLACQAAENIHYDMYYHKERETFFAKCMGDIPFGGRIHYHAIDDGSAWGIDTGAKDFLQDTVLYETQAELANLFEPALPALPLLIVFGFPALCNWYPDTAARNDFDINGSLNILETAQSLWQQGYLNALAPDDAINNGRITLDEAGRFDYCGHKFEAMLYLHPQYAKKETVAFLQDAIRKNANLRIVGRLTRGFDGLPAEGSFLLSHTVAPDFDAGAVFGIERNDIPYGCRLADGSVIVSHYVSLRNNEPYTVRFTLQGMNITARFKGVFAIRLDEEGRVEKLACGELLDLTGNGVPLLPEVRGKNILLKNYR